jgi:hypothetical protein
MIEIIRSVKVYKPSKTFRQLFIHLSLGLVLSQNHHFEILPAGRQVRRVHSGFLVRVAVQSFEVFIPVFS